MNSKELATKKDLQDAVRELATKKELQETNKRLDQTNHRLDRLTGIVLQNSEDIRSMNITLQDVAAGQRLLISTVSELSGAVQEFRQEKAASDAGFFRQQKTLDDHERRIVTLETK